MAALTFCSGAAALVYETLWVRLLGLEFGVSSFAVATVLAVFMLGLGLGSLWFGRVAERAANPLRLYALLELLIGLASIGSYLLLRDFPELTHLYALVYDHLGLYSLSFARLAIALLILLPPTVLIGGTIPLLVQYLTPDTGAIHRFSLIYLWNTLGAFAGTCAAGLYLVKRFGVLHTLLGAAAVNAAVAGVSLLASRWLHPEEGEAVPASAQPAVRAAEVDGGPPADLSGSVLAIGAFVTGFVTIGTEVLWVRILSIYGSATTFSFTLIVGGFLLGITFGSTALALFGGRIRRPAPHLIAGALIAGALISGVLVVFTRMEQVVNALALGIAAIAPTSWFLVADILGFGLALVASSVMGALFPLILMSYARLGRNVGRSTGVIYAVNTGGCVAGSIAVGFVLVPAVGLWASTVALSLLCLALAGLVFAQDYSRRRARAPGGGPERRRARALRAAAPVLLCCLVAVVLAIAFVGRRPVMFLRDRTPQDDLWYYAEGLSATVSVMGNWNNEGYVTGLFVDSEHVAGTNRAMVIDSKLLAHIPLLLADSPRSAVTVGYGTGGTSYSMLLHGVDVYALEIEREVVRASGAFKELNHGSLEDPRLHLVLDDARQFLAMTDQSFDVIVTDVTNLKYKKNPSLYTEDFFRIMQSHLRPDGVAAAWIPLGGLSFEDLRTLMATFQAVFPHATGWIHPFETTHFMVLVGTPKRLAIDLGKIGRRLDALVGVRQDLQAIGIRDASRFASLLMLGEEDFRTFVRGAPLHTDDLPILEFSDLRDYFTTPLDENVDRLRAFQREHLDRYLEAR